MESRDLGLGTGKCGVKIAFSRARGRVRTLPQNCHQTCANFSQKSGGSFQLPQRKFWRQRLREAPTLPQSFRTAGKGLPALPVAALPPCRQVFATQRAQRAKGGARSPSAPRESGEANWREAPTLPHPFHRGAGSSPHCPPRSGEILAAVGAAAHCRCAYSRHPRYRTQNQPHPGGVQQNAESIACGTPPGCKIIGQSKPWVFQTHGYQHCTTPWCGNFLLVATSTPCHGRG